MIIVISGPPGGGKTTLAKKISEKYEYEYVSSGRIFREIAKELNVDIITLNRIAETDRRVDVKIDSMLVELLKKDKVVVESHIAAWILKGSRKDVVTIYVTASLERRAKRIAERDKISYDQALKQILSREESHRRRFFEFYGINITDLSVFDLVINTDYLSPGEAFSIVDGYLKTFSKLWPL